MSFRARVALALASVALLPLAFLAVAVRRELDARLTAASQARVDALAAATEATLDRERRALADRLAAARDALADDDRLRLFAARGGSADRAYVLDAAGGAMHTAGLAMLQLQDEHGRIVSSGQFRNEYDRLESDLPVLLARAPGGAALVSARTPDGPRLVLARVDSLRLGGRRLTVVGGVAVDDALLARLASGPELSVSVITPELTSRAPRTGELSRVLRVPWIGPANATDRALGEAQLVIAHSRTELDALRARIDRWVLAALALAGTLGALAALWVASLVTRPVRELAARAALVDLDHLDADLEMARVDEIGELSRLLAAMTRRMRASAARLREAERRATVGELARQVTHDVKNGLVPIRHVLRHLAQVERDEPEHLAAVFSERRPTLEASVAYLDELTARWRRLAPHAARGVAHANAVLRAVAASAAPRPGVTIALALDERIPAVAAEPLVLRRMIENLVANAIDAIDGRGGTVTLASRAIDRQVRLTVADTGAGMTREQLSRAFDDFYTTKPDGTGLGLSIVRRLAGDLGASLRVETAPGAGTSITLTLPASPAPAHDDATLV